MSFCSEPTYQKSRKRRMCHWCWTHIEIGDRYASYFWADSGDHGSCNMHPECLLASHKWCEKYHESELPLAGTYNRGCWCGEDEEECKCKKGGDK